MIRDAMLKDAKHIAHVHVRSWQQAYVDLMPADFLASLTTSLPQKEAHWARSIESKQADTLVAEVNGNVIGWLSLGPCRDADTPEATAGEVMAIYVLADYWGHGIGAQLWQAGFQRLGDQGYTRISLWVLAANQRAIRFYTSFGGTEEPGSRRTLVRGGVTLEEVPYVWTR
ncbi:GNAT family N-acetyltransferase [Pseudomonas sp. L1(2025)]|uniref:GNAT family N-acetyltransferase n=1 Tax=Pseudomonas sp. L1(2025) TaxID=3449429 RepID=UPI003F690132